MNPLIQSLTEGQLRTDIPAFRPGDTVRVHAKVVEGTRERIQIFEGVVFARRGSPGRRILSAISPCLAAIWIDMFKI